MDRPKDPAKFNGTVMVEWLNVTGGVDVATTWIQTHNELIREGYAWVGVSTQAAGVNAAKTSDPSHYAALSHPGDSYSYDIFSQAGQAVRDSAATFLDGLRPRTLLAIGESQWANRLTMNADAVQPRANVYAGILAESRGGVAPVLSAPSQAPQAAVPVPDGFHISTDLRVPILVFETETDLVKLGYLAARQPDSARFRLWEVAGTAHADTYITPVGPTDTGDGQGDVAAFNILLNPPSTPDPAHPRGELQHADQRGAGPLRPGSRGPRPEQVGDDGSRVGSGTAAADRHQRRDPGVRPRRQRQRRGWHPHAVRGRSGGDPLRPRPGGLLLLHALLYDGALQRGEALGAVSHARAVRRQLVREHRRRGDRRVHPPRRRLQAGQGCSPLLGGQLT
ncbi:hypothetical protein GCM10011578_050660 [Streptomyces fuscichromogenes]|uniref:Alpha/beta hydrolase domain-containing protein n=1 Tax=Streptomyces fuscichromogenes TaxID=1324013 RepID=A0A918CST7_9ACTN|nr:hypothetical protein GCM10011578_050660 [Streptomyces fuscichromogenes]